MDALELRNQREICCDDLVLGQKADRLAYANALTDLAMLPVFTQNRLAMTAVSTGQFSQRIARIMGVRAEKSSRQPLVFWAAGLALVAFLANAAVPKTGDFSKKIGENSEKTAVNWQIKPVFNENDSIPKSRKFPEGAEKPAPDVPTSVAMSAEKFNVFYIGVDNPLRIAASGFAPEDLRVNLIGNGTIDGHVPNFLVKVTSSEDVAVEVFGKKNGVERPLERKIFRAQTHSRPGTDGRNPPIWLDLRGRFSENRGSSSFVAAIADRS